MHNVRRPPLRRIVLAGLSACLMALVPAATVTASADRTEQDATHHSRTWHVAVGAQSTDLAIQTMAFYPHELWVDQGDTVVWQARSAEIHTVTFLSHASPCPPDALCTLPPGDPADPRQSTPRGGSEYDGSSYYNSGIMTSAEGDVVPLPPFVQVQESYRLKFPASLAPGTYSYYCLIHGMAMRGTVIVQKAGTPYPFGEEQYERRSRQEAAVDVADGYRLWASAKQQARRLSQHNGHPTVLVGAMDSAAMVMRFIGQPTTVRAGTSLVFESTSMSEPHTVTFGSDQTGCGSPPCNPGAPWNVSTTPDGNVAANYPGLNGGYTGSPRNLNSGLMLGLPPAATGAPSRLVLTFTEAGTFSYICALHDYMGMVGTVQVRQQR